MTNCDRKKFLKTAAISGLAATTGMAGFPSVATTLFH